MTVWLVRLLLKGALVELLETEGADKVLRMEFAEHGRDASSADRFMTTSTKGTSFLMVVSLAIWLTFMIKE